MARKACLAIGVSTVTPVKNEAMRFGYLDGAVQAARAIAHWAASSGFGSPNIRVVDDEPLDGSPKPVTRARVQRAVDELFPAGADRVEHLVLAFCGHGLTNVQIGNINWLFSDSLEQKYRVVADAFYAELLLHGIGRITLITDACREAPQDLDLLRLDAVRGIVVDGERIASPRFDMLAACQDGQLGYMVSDASSADPGKCVFSGVVTDVLWGLEPAAVMDGVITTARLGSYVRDRTAERAAEYKLVLNPHCVVDPDAIVLFDTRNPPRGPNLLQPWPAVARPAAQGLPREREFLDPGNVVGFETSFELDKSVPRIPQGSRETARLQRTPVGRGRLKAPRRTPASPRDATPSQSVAALRRSLASSWYGNGRYEADLVAIDRRAKVWSSSPAFRVPGPAGRRSFVLDRPGRGQPLLVEFGTGDFTPFVPYDGLRAVVQRASDGSVLQTYGQNRGGGLLQGAIEAISDFAAGLMKVDRIDRLAATMRSGKHADPVLGVISAYLYRAIADYDSIRRMAHFYIEHGQPIPFDIVLLGEMETFRLPDGALGAHVPAVRARRGGSNDGRLPHYVTMPTPAGEGTIGGRCPWLGLGWDYVGLQKPGGRALVEGLAPFAAEIKREGFTVLSEAAGRKLAKAWRLSEN